MTAKHDPERFERRGVDERPLNKLDAKNRAFRTFLQGLAIDLLVALAMLLATVFIAANSWSELEWYTILFSVGKTIVMTVAAFIMRRFVDQPGSIALPPNPPGQPSDRPGDQLRP
jgi:uncharacterized membrane protein YcjF (UPF0283 family)